MNEAMMQKSFSVMTSEEKVQELKRMSDELMSRTARHNDEISYLRQEVLYWRRLHAIKEGLSNEQIDRLFNMPYGRAGL